jgi:hypothetical protein
MRFGLCLAGLLALGAAATADDTPATPPATKDVKKYADAGTFAGKLAKVNTTTSEIWLEYRTGAGRNVKTEGKDFTLADEPKVWFRTPPQRLDDDGNPKKLTPAELKKMMSKSGPTRGWYAGELADLHPGQMVTLVLGKPKDAAKKPAPKEKGVAPEKEFVYVTAVLVTADVSPPKPDTKK